MIVSGPKQLMPKYFTQALKSESLHLCDYWKKGGAEMRAVFWNDEVCYKYNEFDGQMTHQDAIDLN